MPAPASISPISKIINVININKLGHLLCQWPDLYDYGQRDGDYHESAGLGVHCLMAAGSHTRNGKAPAPPCPQLRHLSGWTDEVRLPTINEPVQTLTLPADNYAKVYRLGRPGHDNESFFIENRRRRGLNYGSVADGLAVYHCDAKGSNEWEEGTATRHYQVALVQADGKRDLEKDNNQGDPGDLFHQGDTIDDSSPISNDTPTTRYWDDTKSGLAIDKITFMPDGDIQVTLGRFVRPTIRQAEFHNDLLQYIPEFRAFRNTGLSSTIPVTNTGIIEALEVTLSVRHTWRGDLRITLAHDARSMVVFNPDPNDSGQTVHLTVDVTRAFAGGRLEGTWVLNIVDNARRDTGKLLSWSLRASYRPRAEES